MPPTSSHHPFASPNAIPPRTSSSGILNVTGNSVPLKGSVLRPLSEIDWLGQSKKTKLSHSVDNLNTNSHQRSKSHQLDRPRTMASDTSPQAMHTHLNNTQAGTSYPTPLSPPSGQAKRLGRDLIYGNGAAWTVEKERILLGPYDYLYGHPGKDIRSQCIAAFNLWLKVPPERLHVITSVVGMLHTASLLCVPTLPIATGIAC